MRATIATFFQDLRYATRVLRRDPGFTFFAVLTIALALGANAAIFSLIDGVLLKSVGYPEPERIVQLWEKQPRGGRNGIAPANYIDWTKQSHSFESMAAITGAGDALIQSVARAITRVDKTQVLDQARTVEQMKNESLMSRRLTTSLHGGLSLLAMLLACAGIYGVLSFVTARRRHEVGIRMALGATRAAIIRLVVRGGAIPVFVGILVCLGGALGLARFIQSMLFATDPIDPMTLAGVSVLFAAVALMACVVPAWRAAHVDPMTALREQ